MQAESVVADMFCSSGVTFYKAREKASSYKRECVEVKFVERLPISAVQLDTLQFEVRNQSCLINLIQ